MRPAARRNRTESILSVAILLVLGGIAAGLFLEQFHYDVTVVGDAGPAEIRLEESASRQGPSFLEGRLPAGLVALSETETFGRDDLSDKINGKAELYLSAGFVELKCRRFADSSAPGRWMQVFVYDMAAHRNAFGVYGTQRRADAPDADLADFAYKTTNALFFVHGRYYVEIIASEVSEALAGCMMLLGREFVAQTKVSREPIAELELFPTEHMRAGGVLLVVSSAFGMERFDNVFMAEYTIDGAGLSAFVSVRQSPARAAELAAAYYEFLLANGAEELSPSLEIPSLKAAKIFDTFEMIFTRGSILAGVRQAADAETAGKLARMLNDKLSEGS